jgi:hypothetical protein
MGAFGIFETKISVNDMTFVIKIKNPPIYPPEKLRVERYEKPLTTIFKQCFEEIAVEYFKNERGRLGQINVVCSNSIFKYKKAEEREFYEFATGVFRSLSKNVEAFFGKLNLKANLDDVYIPSDPTLLERMFCNLDSPQSKPKLQNKLPKAKKR